MRSSCRPRLGLRQEAHDGEIPRGRRRDRAEYRPVFLSGLISVIGKFGKRVMTTNGVIYPYWEKRRPDGRELRGFAADPRYALRLMPAVCLTIVLVKLTVREIKRGY